MAHISTRQLSNMCDRIGRSMEAGVDIVQVLQTESQHGPSAYCSNMVQVANRVGKGMTLAESLRECGGYFPSLACELVDVGEQTGNLESVLLRLGEHYQHMIRMRRNFLLGIIWPSLQLLGAIVIIGLLILILGLISSSASVFGLSGPRGLGIYTCIVAGAGLVLFLVGRGLMRGWFGPGPGKLLLRVPVVGKTIKTMALARFSWTFSLALNAGIDAGRAVRMAMQSTQNSHFTRHTAAVEGVVSRGGQFHEALRSTGAFPDEFLTSLENAETTGTEVQSLTRLSEDYQKRAEAATTALAFAASMAVWAAIGILLVFLIFHMFINMYLKPINEALRA